VPDDDSPGRISSRRPSRRRKEHREIEKQNLGTKEHTVITGYFSGIIHSTHGVWLVLITCIAGHNCTGLTNKNRGVSSD
jgi:hypothetical protein